MGMHIPPPFVTSQEVQAGGTVPELKNKVALVTGGASGIGKATAAYLAACGASVVITDIQAPSGDAAAAELGATFLVQDVTHEARWNEVIQEVMARHGALHVLVNNAGVLNPPNSDPESSRLEDWRKIFAVNVEGVFLGCRAAIPAMRASGGGAIVNMSSVASFLATPFALAYGASKAAVRHITKSVAQHCAEKKLNIRCNSVHPGIVRTAPWDKLAAEMARARDVPIETILKEAQSAVPMGDLTRTQDVAAAVAFLASEDSRHITGSELVIDGGLVHCDTYYNTALSGQH